VTWAVMEVAGRETTACPRDQFAPLPATIQSHLFVLHPLMPGVTMAMTPMVAGEVITAFLKDIHVLHLVQHEQLN